MGQDGIPTFGDALRRLRRAAGLTQETLAEQAGLSARGISDLERGLRTIPRQDTLDLLLEALDPGPEDCARLVASANRRVTRDDGQSAGTPRAVRIPIPVTPLLGRDEELTAIRTMLAEGGTRLLTITGPGGIGKTRVAIEVAMDMEGRYPDGVAFIPFAALADPLLVIDTVAQVLGVPAEATRQPLINRLGSFLGDRQMLLVLDNLEHLLDAVADLVADLLSRCPGLTVLGTSRMRLAVAGEQLFPLNVLDAEAAQTLFVSRARALQPRFSLTSETTPIVAEICRRLDGLPLAIELAAARAAVLPPGTLLARLEQRLPLLVGGNRDAPARQRTLRSTIAWSYDLLIADEQRHFRQLSVFVGGWTLDAAEAAFTTSGDTRVDILNVLSSLIHQSLVRTEPGNDEPGAIDHRFSMLETIRDFALEKLEESGEVEAVRARQAGWVQMLLEQGEREFVGPDQPQWLRRLEDETGNLRAALDWAIARGETETALAIGGSAWQFWFARGRIHEGRDWLARAVAMEGGTTKGRAHALDGLGALTHLAEQPDAGIALVHEAIALRRAVGDPLGIAHSLHVLGTLHHLQDNHSAAAAVLEEALEHYGTPDDVVARAWKALALNYLGACWAALGDSTRALEVCEEALALQREVGSRQGIALALYYLAELRLAQSDLPGATAAFREGLQLLPRGDQGAYFLAVFLPIAGMIATLSGRPPQGARLGAAAEAMWGLIGTAPEPRFKMLLERLTELTRSSLTEETYHSARAAGRAMTGEEAVTEALNVLQGEPVTSQPDPVVTHGLSPREQEVLRLIGSGHSNAQIADALSISPRTVTTHASHILDKLGLSSRAEVIAFAHREQLA